MLQTFSLLSQSRKFWIGTITVLAVIAATVALATGKITAEGFVPFITSVTTIGGISISAIAWEDGKQKGQTSLSAIAGEVVTQPAADTKKDGAS